MAKTTQDLDNHPDRSLRGLLLSVAGGLLPGGVAGSVIGLLVVFLNPQIALSVSDGWPLVFYFGLLGLVAATLVLLPFLWRNLDRAVRFFPWAMTFVLAATALFFGVHASRWAFYLPTEVNRNLVYAAAILTLLGLVAFYTALLHTLHRRPYSSRSLGLVAACGMAALVLIPTLRPQSTAPATPSVRKPAWDPLLPIVVIGLDGATLEALLPMVEQGSLPMIGRLLEQGVLAPVSTLRPPRSDALWTSVATGTWPFHHQLQGSSVYRAPWGLANVRLLPEGLGFHRWGLLGTSVRPVTADDLKRKPLWQIYRELGLTAEVVGWPGDQGHRGVDHLSLPQVDGSGDATFVLLGDLLAPSVGSFGGYTASQGGDHRTEVEEAAAELEVAYETLDRAIASWDATLPEEKITVLVSVHGFAALPRWREFIVNLRGQDEGQGTAKGGNDGVLIVHGPGIRRQERLPSVRLVDIMPTLAYAVGLPVAADLDGEVITQVFAPEALAQRPLTFVPSYQGW